jgi:Fe2+ or Zn2+ uptake regulation protein
VERVTTEAASKMRSEGRRLGAARRQVIDAVAAHDGPVSAEQLAEELPEIHVSSIYRSLNMLEELGLVRHVHLSHGPAVFEVADRATAVRYLVCEVCGRAVAVSAEVFASLHRKIEREHDFLLDSGHFALSGRCVSCERDTHTAH